MPSFPASPLRTARHVLSVLVLAAATSGAQVSSGSPFGIGERLSYSVRVAGIGTIGHGVMSVGGPDTVRDVNVWVLRFETDAGVGPLRGHSRSASWIDPQCMTSLRFSRHERHLFSAEHDSVEIMPAERRWTSASGATGEIQSDAPLDELSFIYFIRTLPLDDDSLMTFTRHYDTERSPTTVRVVGRESVTTKAGTFASLIVELRVRDPRHYRGEGVIRLSLSDDARRIPVRIESALPHVGVTVLTLESYTVPPVERSAP